ncbi:glucosamine inositolphosphorylceramide transferase family protein [Haladaptatus sp. DFWS20]|uniref:glucosamine inositolphosphorylceramide transferase family protein n=1 Tax=Haladaptatus sp. DFWS20 TaxID=3403467 RepID=UPI003EBD9F0A
METPSDPLDVSPAPNIENPVLRPSDVSDTEAKFVADPFLFIEDGSYHLFFELLVADEYGKIGHAISQDGRQWDYNQIVLDPGYHLSFPYVFKWDGEYYMSPEDGRDPNDVINLYRATDFPTGWEKVVEMNAPTYGENDHVLFRWQDRWWLLVGNNKSDGQLRGELYLYYSDELVSDSWTPHSENPVVTGRKTAVRPAGRPIVRDDYVLVFLQDITVEYGNQVWAYQITDLSPSTYVDTPAMDKPVVTGTAWTEKFGLADRADNYLPISLSKDWNADRMHQFDPWYVGDSWLCAVDGYGDGNWSIGMYTASP